MSTQKMDNIEISMKYSRGALGTGHEDRVIIILIAAAVCVLGQVHPVSPWVTLKN